MAGKPDSSFQYHHQPFVYFKNFEDGSVEKAKHLKNEKQFLKDIKTGNLPEVCFIKSLGKNNEHPGYSDVYAGQRHVARFVRKIMKSKY